MMYLSYLSLFIQSPTGLLVKYYTMYELASNEIYSSPARISYYFNFNPNSNSIYSYIYIFKFIFSLQHQSREGNTNVVDLEPTAWTGCGKQAFHSFAWWAVEKSG